MVLDSRFIGGLNDGDAVSTWSGRAGTTINGTATLTTRPAYQTNVQGGQPIVRFDGINDSIILSSTITSTNIHIFSVLKKLSTNISATLAGNNSVNSHCNNFSDGVTYFNDGTNYREFATGHLTQWGVIAASRSGTQGEVRVSGVSFKSTFTATAAFAFNRIGSGNGFFSSADFAASVIFQTALTAALEKRIEHAAAFSFKIPCS